MDKRSIFTRSMFYIITLTSMHFTGCWTVKVINLTDEKVTININSSQKYPGWENGRPIMRECSFIGENVEAHATRDFDYKTICVGACTQSVTITSPVSLSASNPLTSCSNVIVMISKDASNQLKIAFQDWSTKILNRLKEREKMPVQLRTMYDTFGDRPIQSLEVFRQPILAGVSKLLKAVAGKEIKKLGYDELFHTGFIMQCGDQWIRLEKEQTVGASKTVESATRKSAVLPEGEDSEERTVTLPSKAITFAEFLNNAMEGDPDFWKYDPVKRNCQLFVLQCLEKNDIPVPDDLNDFIYQDAGKILEKHSLLKGFAQGATSVANRLDSFIEELRGITIQNGTPYTIRVITRFAGESKTLKSCLPRDFLLKSGDEKTVIEGICLCEGVTVASSLQGDVNGIPYKQLQAKADIFAQSSSTGKGKLSTSFLIRSVGGKKFRIEETRLSTVDLQQLAAKTRDNTTLNLNLK